MVLKSIKKILKRRTSTLQKSAEFKANDALTTASCTFSDADSQPEATDYVSATNDLVKCFNDRDIDGITNLVAEGVVYQFFGPDDLLQVEMPWDTVVIEFGNAVNSFPDLRFVHKVISCKETQEGAVVVVRLVTAGTHTGAPYAFAACEPIEAKGKKVVNDPEEYHYFFRDDKVHKIEVHPKGEMTGPAGLYTQLGK